jgi:pantetheine-phosphate adenylyltransferase
MRKAVCPGSFDPPTFGHLDVIGRAATLFDQVTVAVLVNDAKVGLFTPDERIDMLRTAVAERDNVVVDSFAGLLVDYCVANGIGAIVKGIRAADFDYELQMAQMNRNLAGIDTVFVPTGPQWSFVASSLVKEVARLGGDVSDLVPSYVVERLTSRFAEHQSAEPGAPGQPSGTRAADT